jgi:hypothetical protein
MPVWLFIWIGRWLSGERFRKATPKDYRFHFAGLFVFGAFMFVFGVWGVGSTFMDRANAIYLWLASVIVITAVFFASVVWSRLVPAAVSLILAIITWGLVVWLLFSKSP